MVITILKSRSTTSVPMEYNGSKVMENLATIEVKNNIEGIGLFGIEQTFKKYESNPNISAKTKNISMHIAVSPGAQDNASKDNIIAFIREYMQRIGYDEQPYVVFEHFDIERHHFHIVSVNVDKTGRCIRNSFDNTNFSKYTTRNIINELGPKYGFILGKNPIIENFGILDVEDYVIKNKRFHSGGINISNAIAYLYEEALQYNFKSLSDFKDILLSMGLKMVIRGGITNKKKKNVFFNGLTNMGKTTTPEISLNKLFGNTFEVGQGWNRYIDMQAENNTDFIVEPEHLLRIKSTFDVVLPLCSSSFVFREALQALGMDIIFHRENNSSVVPYPKGKTLMPITGFTLVDKTFHRVYGENNSNVIMPSSLMRVMEADGVWDSHLPKLNEGKRLVTKEIVDKINTLISVGGAQSSMNVKAPRRRVK